MTAEGRCDGAIAFAPLGEGGFGYDPVFLVPEKGKTFGQLTAEEKSEISHRGRAAGFFRKTGNLFEESNVLIQKTTPPHGRNTERGGGRGRR